MIALERQPWPYARERYTVLRDGHDIGYVTSNKFGCFWSLTDSVCGPGISLHDCKQQILRALGVDDEG
jgi:hypothetical protein